MLWVSLRVEQILDIEAIDRVEFDECRHNEKYPDFILLKEVLKMEWRKFNL